MYISFILIYFLFLINNILIYLDIFLYILFIFIFIHLFLCFSINFLLFLLMQTFLVEPWYIRGMDRTRFVDIFYPYPVSSALLLKHPRYSEAAL